MNNGLDKCSQLRKLQERLMEELRVLKEDVREEEREGVENPVETSSIIKSLQKTLTDVELQLQKCPDTD